MNVVYHEARANTINSTVLLELIIKNLMDK